MIYVTFCDKTPHYAADAMNANSTNTDEGQPSLNSKNTSEVSSSEPQNRNFANVTSSGNNIRLKILMRVTQKDAKDTPRKYSPSEPQFTVVQQQWNVSYNGDYKQEFVQ